MKWEERSNSSELKPFYFCGFCWSDIYQQNNNFFSLSNFLENDNNFLGNKMSEMDIVYYDLKTSDLKLNNNRKTAKVSQHNSLEGWLPKKKRT